MANMKAAETYGEAIFQLAKENNILEQMETDLLYVKDLLEELPEFRKFIEAPVLESESKIPVIEKVLKDGISEMALHFLFVMIHRGRSRDIEAAINQYVDKSREARGISTAKVWVAREMTPEMQEKLKAKLEAEMGKQMILHVMVDPTLVGGIIVQVGDTRFDASVARRLKDLEALLKSGTMNTNKIGVNESV